MKLLSYAIVMVTVAKETAASGTRSWLFENDSSEKDKVFSSELLLFASEVWSLGECTQRCGVDLDCKAFTFTEGSPGSCRGHSGLCTPTTSQLGARTYTLTGALLDACFDPCNAGSHTVLDQSWRLASRGVGANCDRLTLTMGWYRFTASGQNAVLSQSCVSQDRCSTTSPVWIDLQGQARPAVGEQITVHGRTSYAGNCYDGGYDKVVLMKNCGTFYVYRVPVPPVSTCNSAYCTVLQ